MKSNVVICGDCLPIMSDMPDKCVDLIVTDPPYGVRKEEEWDNKEHFIECVNEWLSECRRISPLVIWFCAGAMIPEILKHRDDFFRLLIWNKPDGSQYAGASNNNIWYSSEPILLFGKKDDWNKKGKESCYGYSVFNARTVAKKKFGHPTTKPIELMEWLIMHHSNSNDLICDPFAGSGSTLVACKNLGRRYLGIELDPKYVAVANERLSQQTLEFK